MNATLHLLIHSSDELYRFAVSYCVSGHAICHPVSCQIWFAFSALTLLVGGRKGVWRVKTEWWGTGMVICLERDADLHMAHLMPLPLTVSCFSKIQTGFTFLVPAHPGNPGKRAVKRVCVCVWSCDLV